MPFDSFDKRLQFLWHRQRVLDARSRIDRSTPISYYSCPKSIHYVPFAQRRSSSSFGNRFPKQNSRRQKVLVADERIPYSAESLQSTSLRNLRIVDKLKKSSSYSRSPYNHEKDTPYHSSTKNLYSNCESKIAKMECYQPPLSRKTNRDKVNVGLNHLNSLKANNKVWQDVDRSINGEATFPNHHGNAKDPFLNQGNETEERMNRFKDAVLTRIINRGVFTDRIVLDCLKDCSTQNQILTREELEAVVLELTRDLNVNADENFITNFVGANQSSKTKIGSETSVQPVEKYLDQKRESQEPESSTNTISVNEKYSTTFSMHSELKNSARSREGNGSKGTSKSASELSEDFFEEESSSSSFDPSTSEPTSNGFYKQSTRNK